MQGTNWVKVSDRRPRGGEQVIVVDTDGFMHLATHQYNAFQIIIKQDGELIETVARFVTHWMPLPPMPEGE
ncbi:TPA: DUF551 domain-containing protein [Providencia alcalifaciens]